MSDTATDGGWQSTPVDYNRVHDKKRKGPKQKNDYFMWFLKYGRPMFREKYGVDYNGDNREDHAKAITVMWNEARAQPGGWKASAKISPKERMGSGVREALPVSPVAPSKPKEKEVERSRNRRIHFMRHTVNEVNIRCDKVFTYLTSKFNITMKNGGRGKNEDDVIRDLSSFVLIVHEYTSNIKGDRVSPAEVTLLTFSLSRGMQKLLSKVVTFNQLLVTDKDDLNDSEYNCIISSYDKTGIAAERYIANATDPSGKGVINTERLKSDLLSHLSDQNNRHAPIMLLKSNYNEAAGMLFTLFPDYWERLEARFGFLDDMFKIYTHIQKGASDTHPIRDYQNLPDAPACQFHVDFMKKAKEEKACTQREAIRELMFLFKDLSDGRVLGMKERYEAAKHQRCSEDTWMQPDAQIVWENVEGEGAIGRDDGREVNSSESDSDVSIEDGMPVIPAHDTPRSGYGNDHSRRNSNDEGGRGGSQSSSIDRYGGGRGREDYGNREKENNWSGEQPQRKYSGGNGYSHSSFNGDRRNGSDDGRRKVRDRSPSAFNKSDRPSFHGPPPGLDDDTRPAQRRRAASPTHSERGTGGMREEEKWTQPHRGNDEHRRGGGGGGVFSRPSVDPLQRGGRGVFGSRTVVEPTEPQRTGQNQGRGVFSNLVPMSGGMLGDEDERVHAHHERISQRVGRDTWNTEASRRERDTLNGGGRQTTREHASPPRDGGKKQEDRLQPTFGGSSSRTGFYYSGKNDSITVPPKAPKKEETEQEREERLTDEKIANSVKFLPLHSFDKYVNEVMEEVQPVVSTSFQPTFWSGAVGSKKLPLHPKKEGRYEEDVVRAKKMTQ